MDSLPLKQTLKGYLLFLLHTNLLFLILSDPFLHFRLLYCFCG